MILLLKDPFEHEKFICQCGCQDFHSIDGWKCECLKCGNIYYYHQEIVNVLKTKNE